MKHWLHPEAEAELGDAAIYYAQHGSRSIAEAFLLEFERVCELLAENPERGPIGDAGFRLYHFKRFPYTVIYEADPQRGLAIYAVAHQRRAPGYWLERP